MKRHLVGLLLIILLASSLLATGDAPVKPQPRDKCPVCGMFVAKYPDFLSEIIFKDGSYVIFDGAKDMFKYYFDPSKYTPGRKAADLGTIYVTGYYDLRLIDGRKAFYVVGSNVYGPMGKELVPFEKEADAKQFMIDHAGKSMLRFQDVTPDLVRSLD